MFRARWIVLAAVALVIGVCIALFVAEHPKLDDARSAADRRWKPLPTLTGLVPRYRRLDDALSAFDAAGGKGRAVSVELHAGLASWTRALAAGDPADEVAAANTLEAEAQRLAADVDATDRFKSVGAITQALTGYQASHPDESLVKRYNDAVRHYEQVRTSVLARPVARTFGYRARPLFFLLPDVAR